MNITIKKSDVVKLKRFGILKSVSASKMSTLANGDIEIKDLDSVKGRKILAVIGKSLPGVTVAPVVEEKKTEKASKKSKKYEEPKVEEVVETPEEEEKAFEEE